MILRYAMASDIPKSELSDKGCIVVSLDNNSMAKFLRVGKGEPFQAGEHLLFYRNRNGLRLGAESFMFQEGHAEKYSNTRYGKLKVDPEGNSVLVGLCDGDYTPCELKVDREG